MKLLVILAILLATLTVASPASAQDTYYCSVEFGPRDRHSVEITLRNAGDGRCSFVTAHRCGPKVRMRRVVVLNGEYRVRIGIDCGDRRLRGLTARVLSGTD